ncbi:imidazole glycerol phosphate synthase subunit HisH [Mariniblastus fucicola]|uniref:Imidazole glycerol phosphate synthase subunit HisH n=1 Tax=Mariniblastus fucicola TaxID=980251 RepID=A0A5B9PIW5_9BACT|nr:imidazole glycerol phosphate synthase subunit HisH [Mariniblastus fucicola]QEG25225.1 Imidazole glycerol phosphate synthase subunit HisH [Mariniblastus fucicola]
MPPKIQIINTGVANIHSLQASFDRIEAPWALTESASDIESASHVVLPGVGAFGAAAAALDKLNLRDAIRSRLEQPDKTTLCICLGLQLLCNESEESPGAKGLGVLDAKIERFSQDVAVPQLGWNAVVPHESCETQKFPTGEAYFANSFRLGSSPAGWDYATTDYDGGFISSVWRGKTLACQFHPELSGKWGQTLLKGWYENA